MPTIRTLSLLLTCAAVVAAADTTPPAELDPDKQWPQTEHEVKAKSYAVVKDEKIDYQDEEETIADDIHLITIQRSDGTTEERAKITSKTFTPPPNKVFVLFPTPSWYGSLTHVDILKDTAVLGVRIKDTETAIRIKAYFFSTDAADFPLRAEGNLRDQHGSGSGSSGGGSSTPTYAYPEHWSAKVSGLALAMRTDVNHDRRIEWGSAADESTPQRPFRFWINDDADYGDMSYGESITDIEGSTFRRFGERGAVPTTNFDGPQGQAVTEIKAATIDGKKDLIDFFPVSLKIQNLDEAKAIAAKQNLTFKIRCPDERLVFKLLWWDGQPETSGRYLTENLDAGFGPEFAAKPDFATVYHVTKAGLDVPTRVRDRLLATGQVMIIVEGGKPTREPLEFVAYLDGKEAAKAELPLSTSTVEDMFRWSNLLDAKPAWGTDNTSRRVTKPSRFGEPANLPDSYCNDRWVVWAHGFNTNEREARGNAAEFFKRFWWSGSNAKYVGVCWFSNEGLAGDYLINCLHALETQSFLARDLFRIGVDPGKTTLIAHSLGNMLLSALVSDHERTKRQQFRPGGYVMLNAALPQEVLSGTGDKRCDTDPQLASVALPAEAAGSITDHIMTHPHWRDLNRRVFANRWFQLWPNNPAQPGYDARSGLTWNRRFSSMRGIRLYNYYSRYDEVLNNWNKVDDDIPDTLWELRRSSNGIPIRTRNMVWYFGQINMGRTVLTQIDVADYAGWGFRGSRARARARAVDPATTDAELRRRPIFEPFREDAAMLRDQAYAADYYNASVVLTESIPAMTRAIGRNPSNTQDSGEEYFQTRVVDMPDEVGTKYPIIARDSLPRFEVQPGVKENPFHHSYILYPAFYFVYQIMDGIVQRETLK